jgi:hypothetical protein
MKEIINNPDPSIDPKYNILLFLHISAPRERHTKIAVVASRAVKTIETSISNAKLTNGPMLIP